MEKEENETSFGPLKGNNADILPPLLPEVINISDISERELRVTALRESVKIYTGVTPIPPTKRSDLILDCAEDFLKFLKGGDEDEG